MDKGDIMVRKYNDPKITLVSINTLDIMSASVQGDGADPYRSAEDWRSAIDSIASGLGDNGMG